MKNNFLGTKCLQLLLSMALISCSTLSAANINTNITFGAAVHLYCNDTVLPGQWSLKSDAGKTGLIASGDKVILFYGSYKEPVGNFTIQTLDGINFALISGQQQVSSIELQVPPTGPAKPKAQFKPISAGITYNLKKQ